MNQGRTVTAIVPARDEELSIGIVIDELNSLLTENGDCLVSQIIVCDNDSTDQTASIAKSCGAIVVTEKKQGYSPACHAALRQYFHAERQHDDILVFVDADQTMRMQDLPNLLAPFSDGADLVIGTRVGSQSANGAMNFQQRWGNRLAILLINWFWQANMTDLGPFRAIRATALQQIVMQDQTYGWTTEMQVRAIQEGLNIVEVSVAVLQRVGQSKISGTMSGNIRAGRAILGTIFKLWWRGRKNEF